MHAHLVLEAPIRPLPGNARRRLLRTAGAGTRRRQAQQLEAPALEPGVSLVHAEQVKGEQGGLVAPSARPHLQNNVTLIRLVPGRQHQGQ